MVGCLLADTSAVAAINRALRVAVPVHDTLGISLKCISSPVSFCTGLIEERRQVLLQKNLFCLVGKQLDCFPRSKPADFNE